MRKPPKFFCLGSTYFAFSHSPSQLKYFDRFCPGGLGLDPPPEKHLIRPAPTIPHLPQVQSREINKFPLTEFKIRKGCIAKQKYVKSEKNLPPPFES